MKRNPYPPEFIAALLDTAEQAKIRSPRAVEMITRLGQLNIAALSPAGARELRALVPKICWLISESDGWFYGPGAEY